MNYRLVEYNARYPGEAFVALMKGRLHAYRRLAGIGGDICLVKAGRYTVYMLNHPALVAEMVTQKEAHCSKGEVLQQARHLFGDGLLTAEGRRHKAHRKVVSPAFTHSTIHTYAATMAERAQSMAEEWTDGETIEVDRIMRELTLDIVAATLFGVSLERVVGELRQSFSTMLNVLSRKTNPILDLFATMSLLNAVETRRAAVHLEAFVEDVIRNRQADSATTASPVDLLDMLLEARRDGLLTGQEVRDEVVTLLISGHETTAVALTWVWYLLANHPEIEKRLHGEIDTVLGGRPPRFEDLSRLTYTRQVMSEVLRLYPPLWAFARQVNEAVDIGNHTIPAGAYVLVSPLILHRNERLWHDPDRFDPKRFGPDAPQRHKFSYFPFSAGPRGCIGEQFAWTELCLVAAIIGQRWRLHTSQSVEPAAGLLTLRPDQPVWMTVSARS